MIKFVSLLLLSFFFFVTQASAEIPPMSAMIAKDGQDVCKPSVRQCKIDFDSLQKEAEAMEKRRQEILNCKPNLLAPQCKALRTEWDAMHSRIGDAWRALLAKHDK